MPEASMSSTSQTVIRKPRIQGCPDRCPGITVILFRSGSAETPTNTSFPIIAFWRATCTAKAAAELFLRRDTQRLHLAIKIAALQAQQFRGFRDIAFGLIQRFQDVFALGGGADVVQTSETLHRALDHVALAVG